MAIYFSPYREDQVIVLFEGDLQSLVFDVEGLDGAASMVIQGVSEETTNGKSPEEADPKNQKGVVLFFEEPATLAALIRQLSELLQDKLEYELDQHYKAQEKRKAEKDEGIVN